MEEEKWKSLLESATLSLSRACEKAAEEICRGEAGVKEIRELTVTLKELSALRRSIDSDSAEGETPTVEVSFDDDGEGWSK